MLKEGKEADRTANSFFLLILFPQHCLMSLMAAIELREAPGRLVELMDHMCSYYRVCACVYVCVCFWLKGRSSGGV